MRSKTKGTRKEVLFSQIADKRAEVPCSRSHSWKVRESDVVVKKPNSRICDLHNDRLCHTSTV